MIVFISPSNVSHYDQERSTTPKGWADRLWTFPELVLAPNRTTIDIYVRGPDPACPHESDLVPFNETKRNFIPTGFPNDQFVLVFLIALEGHLPMNQLELIARALPPCGS